MENRIEQWKITWKLGIDSGLRGLGFSTNEGVPSQGPKKRDSSILGGSILGPSIYGDRHFQEPQTLNPKQV